MDYRQDPDGGWTITDDQSRVSDIKIAPGPGALEALFIAGQLVISQRNKLDLDNNNSKKRKDREPDLEDS